MTLREQFEALDLSTVEGFLGKQEEHLHLDFKRVSNPPLQTGDHRKEFGTLLSGFANSDGGICIWGVDARKGDDGADVAQSILPVDNVAGLVGRLNELTPNATSPLVDGVLHKAISTRGHAGIAATIVPAGDSGPYMAKFGDDRYYKRSGHAFIRMEHFDVADMFGRRAKPSLALGYWMGKASRVDERVVRLSLTVSIENTGRAAAVAPFLAVHAHSPCEWNIYGLDGNGLHGLPIMQLHRASTWEAFGGIEGKLIYPGVTLDVTTFDILCKQRVLPADQPNVMIDYRLAAANFPLIESTLCVPGRDLPVL